MKNIALILFLSALLFSGCVKDEFVSPNGNVPEGEPALVSLKMGMAAMGSRARTRVVPDDVENKIENLHVLIFDAQDNIVTNQRHEGLNVSGSSPLSLDVKTYSGSGMRICIVANTHDAAMGEQLTAVNTYQRLRDIVVTAEDLDFGLNKTRPLMMTDMKENVVIHSGQNSAKIDMQLHFMTAKLTLIVKDATPAGQKVTILGWDVVDAPKRNFVFHREKTPSDSGDAVTVSEPGHWLTTGADYPFETETTEPDGKKTLTQGLYLFENRRGGRVNRGLPIDQYPDMAYTDTDHRGKGWFKPERATAVLIRAMHETSVGTRQIKAYIYLGSDNHGNYDIERGNHYTFTVTVKGLDDIAVDSSIEYENGDFAVDHGDNLTMDSHPDFRPMRIHAPKGVVTMEIQDEAGRTYKDPGFTATWLKISPLNLMFHQVKQTGEDAKWQQDANPTSGFVRGRYIPHTSVRKTLSDAQKWWTAYSDISVKDDDDNEMAFADATYRMCYKITCIPFDNAAAVTNHTLYVYADEFLQARGNPRKAKVRFTFYKDGNLHTPNPEIRIFDISQDGYIEVFDSNNSDAGLTILKEDGTPSDIKELFVFENTEEAGLALNPGIDPDLQRIGPMQAGFYEYTLYGDDIMGADRKPDCYRNGKFQTANAVYVDVQRGVNSEPLGFGKEKDSYRPMYGNNKTGDKEPKPIPAYTGTNSGAPYYYPDARGLIYHPIYKSSAARYCHEKNRDVNGDGIIDESEAHWYMPAAEQLLMAWIGGLQDNFNLDSRYWSVSEMYADANHYFEFMGGGSHYEFDHNRYSVRCVREL